MNDFQRFVHQVRINAQSYSHCSTEQALTYACEELVDKVVGSTTFKSHQSRAWLDRVCEQEDIDVPHIEVQRASGTIRASAGTDEHAICIRGANTTASTILHELAHLMSDGHSHGVLFRDTLVRLTRAHISFEYAAMLHGLYEATGLHVSPWAASARKH